MSLSPNTFNTEVIANYARKLRDDITMATAAWEYFFDNVEMVNGGNQITEQIFYQLSSNANVFAGGVAPVNADFVNNATQATWPPCYYWYSVLIPDTFKILARGEGEIINLFNGQFQGAFASLVQVLGNDVWGNGATRNGATTIQGIQAASTYNSDPPAAYGGITRINSSGTFKKIGRAHV